MPTIIIIISMIFFFLEKEKKANYYNSTQSLIIIPTYAKSWYNYTEIFVPKNENKFKIYIYI